MYVYLYLFQVGNASIDHKSWERPENMMEKRPTLQVDDSSSGSDVATECWRHIEGRRSISQKQSF